GSEGKVELRALPRHCVRRAVRGYSSSSASSSSTAPPPQQRSTYDGFRTDDALADGPGASQGPFDLETATKRTERAVSIQGRYVQNHMIAFEKRVDEYFSTGHLQSNLRGRTLSSGFVTALGQGAQFFITLGS